MTLFEQFRYLEYNYYYEPNVIDFSKLENEKAIEFIKNYFKSGQKDIVIRDIGEIWRETPERPMHTLLLYLLFINDTEIRKILNDKIKELFPQDYYNEKDFLRFAFLLCLYHDYGYKVEIKRKNQKNFARECFTEEEYIDKIPDEYFSSPYTKENIKNYFVKFRKFKEHGFTGGVMLNTRLRENLKDACFCVHPTDWDDFEYRGVKWSQTNDIKFYDLISSVIIKHNIWFIKENDKNVDKYNDYGLQDFILTNEESKLSFRNDPILFFFCLLDSIEPSKCLHVDTTNPLSVKRLLKNYNFNVAKDENKIVINIKLNDPIHAPSYLRNLERLKDWMNLEVEIDTDQNEATIKFNI